VEGVVTTIANFGVFVEIEEGIEGLVIPSECGWAKRPLNPKDVSRKGIIFCRGYRCRYENRSFPFDPSCAGKSLDSIERNIPRVPFSKARETYREFRYLRGNRKRLDGLVHISDVSWMTGEEPSGNVQTGRS
jgi:small subunit ribosomal protein S1